MSWGKGSLA